MDVLRTQIVLIPLRILDSLLQRLIPARRDRVTWMSDPDYIGNAFHLYRHALTTRTGLEHVWLVADAGARARIERDLQHFAGAVAPGNEVRIVDRHSLRGYWTYLRSHRTFHTHGVYPMSRSAPRRHVVSLWHGMPIKCIGALNTISPNRHPTMGTMHLATSSFFRYVIAAAFRSPVERVLLTGLPRCDVLTHPHPLATPRQAIREALGVPVDHRLVLWTPTYRSFPGDASSGLAGPRTFLDDLTEAEWAQIEQLASTHRCTVVIKLHPHDPLNDIDHHLGGDHVRLVRSAEWLATGIELYDMVAVVDGLMSDVSSLLIDFLATSRPLGIIGFDAATYTRDVVFPVDLLLTSSRIHDLPRPGALGSFFDQVSADGASSSEPDDLSPWLYDAPRGEGCETVLAAVGL